MLLRQAYQKANTAAKAAARFEVEVHDAFVQERIDEGFDVAEAGNVPRLFSADEFNDRYRKLLQLSLDRQLIVTLGLKDFESAIMNERIHDVLAPKPPRTVGPVREQQRIQVGDEDVQQIQELKNRLLRERSLRRQGRH